MTRNKIESISELQHKVLYDTDFFHTLLTDLSVNTTEMFRDPAFFNAIRQLVVPLLHTYPFFKIWHAGCSTGEEVFSLAIILYEEGLLQKATIYATDFNQKIIQKASEAIFPLNNFKNFTDNYNLSGGKASLSDYFTINYHAAKLVEKYKKNIVFSDHNLVTDGVFGEMNIILCRNVLIYFNRELQNSVLNLLNNSLLPGGVLCIGTKETLMFSELKDKYNNLHQLNIFKKKYD